MENSNKGVVSLNMTMDMIRLS